MTEQEKGEIIFYKTRKEGIQIDVHLFDGTVWLTQAQMAELFGKDPKTISEHISNIFKEKELSRISTIRNFQIVRQEAHRMVNRNIDHYNLDVIISVGYRVKSKHGTLFRIWATQKLKAHLLKGYTIDQKRLKANQASIRELQASIRILESIFSKKAINYDEAEGIVKVIANYSRALSLIEQYDHSNLKVQNVQNEASYQLTYPKARYAIDQLTAQLRDQGHNVTFFGREKDNSFQAVLGAIYQTFDRNDLIPSVEEKAAHLLYLIIKDHCFVDGNKRIGAFLCIVFLEMNKCLYHPDGSRRLSNNTLVAITLMIAESKPEEKDLMIKLTVNLINSENN